MEQTHATHGDINTRYTAIVAAKLGCAVTFGGWKRVYNPTTGRYSGATMPVFIVPQDKARAAYDLGLEFQIAGAVVPSRA